jgi:cytochrome c oxidase subunit 3
MKVGTIKTDVKPGKKLRKRSRLSGFGGEAGSGGGNGGGGGSNGGDDGFNNPLAGQLYEKSFGIPKILTMFLLVVVTMTFSGVIAAYVVISKNPVDEWQPFNLPFQVYISTLLILVSSLTYVVAQKAVYANEQQKSKKWLLATTVLGGMFISSQILAWLTLAKRGLYLQSNPYASFFYFLTVLHAVHVLGGIIALGYVVLQNWLPTDSEKQIARRREISKAVGWYWHFMGGLWLVLLFLLGFWK